MAKMPQFGILQNSNYEKLEKIIEAQIIKYPAFVYDKEIKQMICINKDGTYDFVKGSNKKEVEMVNELPSLQNADAEVLYVFENAIYEFDETEQVYRPLYHALQNTVNELGQSIESIREDIQTLQENDASIQEILDAISIKNITGSIEDIIDLTTIPDGIYNVVGQYQIPPQNTVFIATSPTLFMKTTNDNTVLLKKISNTDIVNYTINGNEISSDSIVTEAYLDSQGYVTETWVENRLQALVLNINEETINAVYENLDEHINDTIATSIDSAVQTAIDEQIVEATEQQVDNLFE